MIINYKPRLKQENDVFLFLFDKNKKMMFIPRFFITANNVIRRFKAYQHGECKCIGSEVVTRKPTKENATCLAR